MCREYVDIEVKSEHRDNSERERERERESTVCSMLFTPCKLSVKLQCVVAVLLSLI